jgi:hypothetical protein
MPCQGSLRGADTIYGQAGREIVDAARAHDAGVIVMGSRAAVTWRPCAGQRGAQGDPLTPTGPSMVVR